ncbi:hypothetical protein ACFX19_027541 [Malus domestica]
MLSGSLSSIVGASSILPDSLSKALSKALTKPSKFVGNGAVQALKLYQQQAILSTLFNGDSIEKSGRQTTQSSKNRLRMSGCTTPLGKNWAEANSA